MSRGGRRGSASRDVSEPLLDLDPLVERLLNRCGSRSHLVPDTLLVAVDVLNNYIPGHQSAMAKVEVSDAVTCLLDEPAMAAVQDVRAAAAGVRCRHCQSDTPPRLVSCNRSGSSAEALDDGIIGEGGTSDYDVMFEFDGPLRWAAVGTREEPARIDPQVAPQLWAKPTENAGFVTLHWVRTTQCSHESALTALPANSIRQLMRDFCHITKNGQCETPGPAVNIIRPVELSEGGIDHVPCLRVPGWWPDKERFLSRHRRTEFPSAATRADLCRYGVHLVPTGRPGSVTEEIQWRVSLSRAEVVAVRQLQPVQRTTITSVKAMKQLLKKSGVVTDGLKSYYVKTAVLWQAQNTSSESWMSLTDGIHRTLEWLKKRLIAGSMPCFFDEAINVLSELSADQRQTIVGAIDLMRKHAPRLLVASCLRYWNLDVVLARGSEPLSERQLRLRLGRLLLMRAVTDGVRYRPSAPCWDSWWPSAIVYLGRSAQSLLQAYHRGRSGQFLQQCSLFMAWAVLDAADLVSGEQLTPSDGDIITLDATPLTQLFTDANLQLLLGDPAAVAAWCHQQLQRPPAERPAGLTSELDTPRGRAELLLQPELLLQAFSEAAPDSRDVWKKCDDAMVANWRRNFSPPRTLQWCQATLEAELKDDRLERWLRMKCPGLDEPTREAIAERWRQRLQRLNSGDRLRVAYRNATGRFTDRWELLQYYVRVNGPSGQGEARLLLTSDRH